MGVDYSARILVGLPYDELEEYFESLEDEYGWEGELSCVSPYYDASWGSSLFGVEVKWCNDYHYSEIDELTLLPTIKSAHEMFEKITGKKGKLYLSTYGS